MAWFWNPLTWSIPLIWESKKNPCHGDAKLNCELFSKFSCTGRTFAELQNITYLPPRLIFDLKISSQNGGNEVNSGSLGACPSFARSFSSFIHFISFSWTRWFLTLGFNNSSGLSRSLGKESRWEWRGSGICHEVVLFFAPCICSKYWFAHSVWYRRDTVDDRRSCKYEAKGVVYDE